MLLIVAYPLYYILVASFSNPYDVYAGKTFLLPSGFTFDGYHEDPDRAEDSRNLHRTRFDWQRAALRTKQGTPENIIWEGIRRLREMRAHPCFAVDARVSTLESGNRAVLVVLRGKGNERMMAMMNFSEQVQSAVLPDGTSLELRAYEMKIL